jgi:hypothetical protein
MKADADLDLLTAIEGGEVVTQATLKQSVGVSIGLVNALLKRAIGKGLVKARQAPYKRYAYYLTPQGFIEKSRLVAAYLESSLHLFRQARDQYTEIFLDIRSRGARRVILAGRGELAEIALLSARDAGLEIGEIYDREANVERLYDLRVLQSIDDLQGPVDLVITASRHPQEMFDKVRESFADSQVFAPRCLRIMRSPPAPKASTKKGVRR